MLFNYLRKLKERTGDLNYGRDIISLWARERVAPNKNLKVFRVLDIGMGPGADLEIVRRSFSDLGVKVELFGLDSYLPSVSLAEKKGLKPSYAISKLRSILFRISTLT